MAAIAADRHLLFGLLALQNGMIDQDVLVLAFRSWTRDKSRAIAEILVAQGAIDADDRAVLEALARNHLKHHGGDAEKSVVALNASVSIRQTLAGIGDPDIESTLSQVDSGSTPEGDDRTRTYQAGGPADGQRFRVLRPHAKGGLGAVFVALDEQLHREVALKQILDHHADDPASRTRFVLEAEITGGLEHPGIVPVYGLGSYGDGRPYYAMRFVRGDSLKEAIAAFRADPAFKNDPGQRALAFRKLLRRFVDVCNAIGYAHTRGVLHRDIKPANVIVGKHGETLVVDWGLAKLLGKTEPGSMSDERTLMPSAASGSAETLPGSAMGTPAYMSPEQASGDLDRIGPGSDVYSLGATLYSLLTGKPPFVGDDVGAILQSVAKGEFPKPRALDPSIDRALEAVCLKAMALSPGGRYASPRALADDVERWAADEPVTAWREPLFTRAGRWARRHRTTVAAVGLSLATAVVLLSALSILVTNAQRETARALGLVREEQQRTAVALERADANFRRARQAVEDYFTTVSEETLLDEPGMQPLREKLLRAALNYHEAFLRERAADPSVEAEVALSHFRYGVIATMTGARLDAESHLRTALGLFRKLARDDPARLEYRRHIGLTLLCLGDLLAPTKVDDSASDFLRDAVTHFEQLAGDRPEDEIARQDLARSLSVLGMVRSRQRGGSEEAARLLRRSREIMERLISDHPDSPKYQTTLAEIYLHLYANYVGDRRRQEEALRDSERALKLLTNLSERNPGAPRFRYGIGLIYNNRGMHALRQERPGDAVVEFREARRVLLELVRRNPDIQDYHGHLAASCSKLGAALIGIGKSEESFDPLREAADAFERCLAAEPDNKFYQTQFLGTLGNLAAAQFRLARYPESVATHRRALKLAADFCRRDPQDIFLRGSMIGLRVNLAFGLTRMGDYEKAIAEFDESRSIGKEIFGGDGWSHMGTSETKAQILMAYSLREIGRGEEAQQVITKARGATGLDGGDLLDLATYDARGAELLARAGGAPGAVEALRLGAIGSLRRAVDLSAKDTETMRRFGDKFRLLHRPDFQDLMLDAAFPADPFTR